MTKTNFKALTSAFIIMTLAACSSAKKNETASNDTDAYRTPAQVPGGGFVKVLQAGGLSAQEVEQKLTDGLIKNMVTQKVPGFVAGSTFQSVMNNPVLAQKLADAIIKSLKNPKGQFKSAFKLADANATIKQIEAAKAEIAASGKIAAATAKGGMKADGAVSYFGDDAVATYNSLPEGIKAQVKERMTRAQEIIKDMPAKKDTVSAIVKNALKIAKITKHDYLGRWVCATWGDLRQEQALDNLLTITSNVLKDVEGGAKIEKPSDFRPYSKRYLASVTKLSEEVVEKENLEDLEKTCEVMSATN